ncbi:MAG: hypothetical protein ACKO5L_06680, partial [Bacteroidota bacterium]
LKENQPGVSIVTLFKSSLLFPFALLGFVHAALPIHAIKWWVEKSFKRPVYYGSTKMVIATFIVPLLNLPCLFLLPSYLPFENPINWMVSALYFLSIGLFSLAYLLVLDACKKAFRRGKLGRTDLTAFNVQNAQIRSKIQEKIPVA